MAPETENPAMQGRASCDKLGCASQVHPILVTRQAQFLIAVHSVRPELAVMLAAAVFGGHSA